MSQFIQFTDGIAINMDLVTDIQLAHKQVFLTFCAQYGGETHVIRLFDDAVDAFRDWWENHAEVYRCS